MRVMTWRGSAVAARMAWMVLAFGVGIALVPAARASTLDPAVLPTVKAATFEVVAAKPTRDPLSYAKPLPTNLLPYQQRTDTYHSIGTAFAIGPNRYVTAGHVLRAGLNSLWGPLALRDSKGHVYAIGKIEKFSLRKDFVVFSLKHPPEHAVALQVNTHPQMNQKVYAVGNALGTGVVIRGGLYTSDTPENQDGAWKWLRFSAAASPGNSGGPLLDQHGKVIGVVLMKSPEENLNYALPMSEVLNAPKDMAVIDKRIPYGFDLIGDTLPGTFKGRFKLPMSLKDFNAKYLQLMYAFEDAQLKQILKNNAANLFPHGEGSKHLLYVAPWKLAQPVFLSRASNGKWRAGEKKGPKISIGHHGYLRFGLYGKNMLFHLRRPDNVSAQKLRKHPSALLDLFLKTGLMKRHVASAKVKITSMGQPRVDKTYTDSWGRRWQIMEWAIPYDNSLMYVCVLPTPDGYVGFMRGSPASQEHDYLINLEAMTDFFYTNYTGTLAQWKTFLAHSDALPPAFKHIHMQIHYGHDFNYKSRRVAFHVTPAMQKIDADSELILGFSFFPEHGKVIWGASWATLLADVHDKTGFTIRRAPDAKGSPSGAYHNEWKEILHRRAPFDAVAQDVQAGTRVATVAGKAAKDKPSVLYYVIYQIEGHHSQDFMKNHLNAFMQDMHVYEH